MNGPRRESILESQVVLLLAHALSLGLGLIITFLLVRRLDDTGFSDFVLLAGALALASQLVDAGLQPAVIAELARSAKGGQRFLRQVLKQRFLLAVLAIVGAFLAKELFPFDTPWWLLVAAILLLPLRTMAALFSAGRRNRFLAWGSLGVRSLFCAAIIILVIQDGDVLAAILVALVVREIALSIYPCWALKWKPMAGPSSAATPGAKSLALLAGATMFSAAYFHVDLFMLRAMAPTPQVAGYGLSVRVLGPLIVSCSLILAPFLPFLGRGLEAGMSPHRRDVLLTVVAALGVLLPLSLVLQLSQPLVFFVRGEDMPVAAESLAILAWALPAIAFGAAFSTALIMAKRYGAWATITFTGLVINIALNRQWIPDWGGEGAAWATVITEVTVAALAIVVQGRIPAKAPTFESKEAFGAVLAALAPGALALGIYLILWHPDANFRLTLAAVLAVLAATVHMIFGVARTLRLRFESAWSGEEGP